MPNFDVIPSGSFAYSENLVNFYSDHSKSDYWGTASSANKIYNPFLNPYNKNQLIEKVTVSNFTDSLFDKVKAQGGNKIFEFPVVQSYSSKLVEIGAEISFTKLDLMISPLRGSFKPSAFLKTMNCLKCEHHWLKFSVASSGRHDEEIKSDLGKIFKKHFGKSILTIGIIDTVEGGQGIHKLAELLSIVREEYFYNLNLSIVFFLLHGSNAKIDKIKSVEKLGADRIKYNLRLYKVDNLLIEDWDSAIGLTRNKGESIEYIKPSITAGCFYYVDNKTIKLIESEELSKSIDKIISEHISLEIRTNPDFNFIEEIHMNYRDNK